MRGVKNEIGEVGSWIVGRFVGTGCVCVFSVLWGGFRSGRVGRVDQSKIPTYLPR